MRQILLILFLNTVFCFSQRHELTFNTTFGSATNIFKKSVVSSSARPFNYPQNINRKAVSITYSYKVFKKLGLSFFTGFDFVSVKYKHTIIEQYKDEMYNIGNILINKNLINIKGLGLSEGLDFYNGKISLNFGFAFIHRVFFSEVDTVDSDRFDSYFDPNRKYSFKEVTFFSSNHIFDNWDDISYNDVYLNLEYHLLCKAKLNDKLFLNFGFTYTRNFIMFYFIPDSYIYKNGNISHTHIEQVGTVFYPGIKDDFLNFNLGLSYKFDKIKWQKTK